MPRLFTHSSQLDENNPNKMVNVASPFRDDQRDRVEFFVKADPLRSDWPCSISSPARNFLESRSIGYSDVIFPYTLFDTFCASEDGARFGDVECDDSDNMPNAFIFRLLGFGPDIITEMYKRITGHGTEGGDWPEFYFHEDVEVMSKWMTQLIRELLEACERHNARIDADAIVPPSLRSATTEEW